MILFMFSRWRVVTSSRRPKNWRAGTTNVTTMAMPLKIAPATKYGGKIVVCHPGSCETAKSKLTTECTLKTNGVAKAANNKYATSKRCHCRPDPRQPSARMP